MKVERFSIKSCCGGTILILKTDRPLDKNLIKYLVSIGFQELEHFTIAGLIYADSPELIVSGPLGSDMLQVKCKKLDCNEKLNEFERLLLME